MNGNEYLAQFETDDLKLKEIHRLLNEGVYQISDSDVSRARLTAWEISTENIMSIASRTEIGKSTNKTEALILLASALIDGMWVDMPFFTEEFKINTHDRNRFYCFKHSLEKCMNEYRDMILKQLTDDKNKLTKEISKLKKATTKIEHGFLIVLEG